MTTTETLTDCLAEEGDFIRISNCWYSKRGLYEITAIESNTTITIRRIRWYDWVWWEIKDAYPWLFINIKEEKNATD